jgi:phosphoenolpyruvate synthase/pyruvate phosphate dikinase
MTCTYSKEFSISGFTDVENAFISEYLPVSSGDAVKVYLYGLFLCQNPKLDHIYDAYHPAIMRLIQMVIDNGHKEGCWVGICGELGADLKLTEDFIKMGIDELSVSPTFVLPIRKIIREM